jgi:hypothetical protein
MTTGLFPEGLFRLLSGPILASGADCHLYELAAKHVDIAFTALYCADESPCSYLEQHFDVKPYQSFDSILEHRYLFDIDGYSFSGMFLFL